MSKSFWPRLVDSWGHLRTFPAQIQYQQSLNCAAQDHHCTLSSPINDHGSSALEIDKTCVRHEPLVMISHDLSEQKTRFNGILLLFLFWLVQKNWGDWNYLRTSVAHILNLGNGVRRQIRSGQQSCSSITTVAEAFKSDIVTTLANKDGRQVSTTLW